jgi:hypothetical protein
MVLVVPKSMPMSGVLELLAGIMNGKEGEREKR